ncbi:MAG: threonine--tRNA ligase [Proteobacteria bacterium]|nr:MAG: threonine--tRNA ligase [Pseudomonadota bacterium]
MLKITLPDGSVREFDSAVTVLDIAKNISSGLAKATLAGVVNDKLVDASTLITADATVRLITDKDPEGLEVIRHSTAHLLAQAVKQLFPAAQVTIGPVIENGFYYDFSFERPFTPEDLIAIEKKMANLVDQNIKVERVEMSREEAIEFFDSLGEKYKVEIISSIPAGEIISLYKQGDFIDLCRGPHVPSTSKLKAFKLMKVAGAYWRGNSDNEMLQRIYGTAWRNKDELKEYLHLLEEAEKRDHRKIGKQMELFMMSDYGPGFPFFLPKGMQLRNALEDFWRKKVLRNDYSEIRTPIMLHKELWEISGHWFNYRENMYTSEIDEMEFAIKPMNCPGAVLVYKNGLHSYKDLPLRMGELGLVHRHEFSGALHGLFRVRNFTQDDAHIFCTPEQIESEVIQVINSIDEFYKTFGFSYEIFLSTKPEKAVGSDEIWQIAEGALANAMQKIGVPYTLNEGDGAFYGPKLDFKIKDAIGRMWQCGTLQLDFNLPERFDIHYIGEDGNKHRPVMLHRATCGSLERFIGILIEHYEGKFPFWLAPVQAVVVNISEKQAEYANSVYEQLKLAGVRAEIDLSNEKVGYKIRQHSMQKVPYLLVIGDNEVANNQVTVRRQDGSDLGAMSLEEFLGLNN